jgi:hypothetical protein
LRHFAHLRRHGFQIRRTVIAELGPGDSIGLGLAALLAGADRYIGLDVVPFSLRANLEAMLDELLELYEGRTPIPGDDEFPFVRPKLDSYGFPSFGLTNQELHEKASRIQSQIRSESKWGGALEYRAPWTSYEVIEAESLDLIVSQAVLEYVCPIEDVYRGMFRWLKPGSYASHNIDLSAHYISPFWNGHWAYSDWQWRVVKGRREFFLNREPFSRHMTCAKAAGFEVISTLPHHSEPALNASRLSGKYRKLDRQDLITRGAYLILRKPAAA